MSEEAATRLPDHQPWDHAVDLVEDKQPPWGPLYSMTIHELSVLKAWIENMLATGRIRPSKAPCGAPMMFVGKKDPEDPLRPVVDYRGLNRVTVPVKHPIPLIHELQAQLQGAKWFTKIDLKTGFWLVRIREGDEWKTAFRCKYGLFEYTVMPFGMINAPSTFQAMMNHLFRDMLDAGVLVYLDDLLIYATTEEEHDRIVKEVLQRLTKHHLAVSPRKCKWRVPKVEFLGYIINRQGIGMTQDKVECVLKWQPPRSLKESQQFIGFANFYRRFIHRFSAIARPITNAQSGNPRDWKWISEMQAAFKELKERFATAPVLVQFDLTKQASVETDASNFAIGRVLSQKGSDGKQHPVAFHSRKMTPTEINYEIYDKELLSIVDCFDRWRHYLEGATHRVEVFTDHQNLAYFTTAKVLNRRQARWSQKLSSYWFIIHYRPGKQNEKADMLSRLPQHRPEKGGSEDQPITTVLKELHFSPEFLGKTSVATILTSERLCSLSTPRWTDEFSNLVKTESTNDPDYQAQLTSPGKDVEQVEGLLYRKGRLWVPLSLRKQVLESEHDTKVAGHIGTDKTLELVTRNF